MLVAGLMGCVHATFGQGAVPRPRYFKPYTVPSAVRQIALALGPRVQAPGQERLVLDGVLVQGDSKTPLRVIRELPGLLRIEAAGGAGNALVFDGRNLTGRTGTGVKDEDLAEMFEIDSSEHFLNNISTAPLRMLGQRFHVRGETGFGAEVDLFEMVVPIRFGRETIMRTKQFMFDTRTGLLRRVAYRIQTGPQTFNIQTVLSDYSQAQGDALPGRIDRVVNGTAAFTFVRNSAALLPAAADNAFKAQ